MEHAVSPTPCGGPSQRLLRNASRLLDGVAACRWSGLLPTTTGNERRLPELWPSRHDIAGLWLRLAAPWLFGAFKGLFFCLDFPCL